MTLKIDLDAWVGGVFHSQWETRDGTRVPDEDSKLGLKNEAIKIEGAVLYADLADSTQMVDAHRAEFAAEIYKTFLHCAARIVQANGGVITAYDGDRIMAVFIGDVKNTNATKAAFQLRWAVAHIITPAMKRIYASTDFAVKHVCGIDCSELLVAKTGVRGANDLVWVGRAANHAAKLSALPPGYTYISKAVHDRLAAEMKTKDGAPIWEARTWTGFNNTTIYRSNWYRAVS